MKNKATTYFLGFVVIIVWGVIIYKIFAAGIDNTGDAPLINQPIKKEAYNDFSIPKDTTHLLLNYDDPFGIDIKKDTEIVKAKKIENAVPMAMPAAPFNWGFVQYVGFVKNPASKKLLTLLSINGKNEIFNEGETKSQVKLIKNLGDSVKISFNKKMKILPLKPSI